MDSDLLVTVVVLTRNRHNDLKRCLDSLLKQTYTKHKILVIDNGSTDDTPFLLENYAARVIRDEKMRLSYLFNLGWTSAEGDIIAYIADDAEADSRWLENLVETFRTFPNADLVGGPTISMCKQEMFLLYEKAKRSKLLNFLAKVYDVVILDGKLLEPGYLSECGAYSMGAALPSCLKIGGCIHTDLLTTTGMAVRREVFEKIGGFDENFMFNHADGDFFVRAKMSGYGIIFNPKAVIWHYVRMGPSRNAYYIGRDTGYFYMKDVHPKTISGWFRFVLNIAYFNGYWLYKTLQHADPSFLQGIHGFVKGISEYLARS